MSTTSDDSEKPPGCRKCCHGDEHDGGDNDDHDDDGGDDDDDDDDGDVDGDGDDGGDIGMMMR